MALIGKPGSKRDFAQRHGGRRNLAASEIDAQIPQVFADGAAEIFAKHASKMHRVNAADFGDFFER